MIFTERLPDDGSGAWWLQQLEKTDPRLANQLRQLSTPKKIATRANQAFIKQRTQLCKGVRQEFLELLLLKDNNLDEDERVPFPGLSTGDKYHSAATKAIVQKWSAQLALAGVPGKEDVSDLKDVIIQI